MIRCIQVKRVVVNHSSPFTITDLERSVVIF